MSDITEALKKARAVIDRDRTGLAAGLNEVKKIAAGYNWIPDGEWGSYSYEQRTQATLRKEIGNCLAALRKAAEDALHASGRLADEACREIDAFIRTSPPQPSGPCPAQVPDSDPRYRGWRYCMRENCTEHPKEKT